MNTNNFQLNNLLKRNPNHISSSPSEFVLNKNNNETNNSYLKATSSPLKSENSPNNSNQYLNPITQVINNRALSPVEDDKNPVLSPMGFNAAMFLATNSLNDKLSVSSIQNNNTTNHIGSPYNTTPIPSISSNQSSINYQNSFDTLNIPKNSEILYSPDINMMVEANSQKKQSLQIPNSSLILPKKKVASYPSALNTTDIEQIEAVMHSPQIINSPLVSSPTSSFNEFDNSIKSVSSPQNDLTLTNKISLNQEVENSGDVKIINSYLLKGDYNGYMSNISNQSQSSSKKTPSIVLTPSTDSYAIPSQMTIERNRNIIHSSNSLSVNSLKTSFLNDNNNINTVHINSDKLNDNLRLDNISMLSNNNEGSTVSSSILTKKDTSSNQDEYSSTNMNNSYNMTTGSSESSLTNENLNQLESNKINNDTSNDSRSISNPSSISKKTRKRKTQDKQNPSKKKNTTKKGKSKGENKEEISNQNSSSNDTSSKQSSNGRVIKYPKIYECKFPGCNKAFTKAHNLRSHERSHMNDRPYSCKYCDKSFVRQYDLLRHERIHTGVKPYVCKKCLAAFSRNDAYNKHIRSCLEKKD